MLIPLSLIKKQVVVDEWYTDDDEYLESLVLCANKVLEISTITKEKEIHIIKGWQITSRITTMHSSFDRLFLFIK